MPIQLGAHVDQVNPIEEAAELGAEIVQIHLGDPQSWQGPEIRYPGGAAALKADARAAGVGIYVHSPYIINVASTNNRIRIPSRKILQRHVSAAAEIGALGVVVHGGHVTADDDPGAGYVNWFKAVDGLRLDCPILIENTAGGKHAMARHVTGIERLWAAIGESENITDVGFCLDTCHAHASGEPLDGLVGRIRAITGRIDLVHVNDSRDPAGSGNDRHANLGDGQLDPAELIALVKAAGAPSLLETPGGVPDRLADLAWLAERI